MSKNLYGFSNLSNGITAPEKAAHINAIFHCYLLGHSLNRICNLFHDNQIPSPTGNEHGTSMTIRKILSNPKYVPLIIDENQYLKVQQEKQLRANFNTQTGIRKTTRYNSLNVLSGLLICKECGRNYRRYTRGSGEVVWRGANRVEHSKLYCKQSPSIAVDSENDLIATLQNTLQFGISYLHDKLCLAESEEQLSDKMYIAQLIEQYGEQMEPSPIPMFKAMARAKQAAGIYCEYRSFSEISAINHDEMAPGYALQSWLRSRNTLALLRLWEQKNNPSFDGKQADAFIREAEKSSSTLTLKKWISRTNANGIVALQGRYGGTYAHPSIARDFEIWLSSRVRLEALGFWERDKMALWKGGVGTRHGFGRYR